MESNYFTTPESDRHGLEKFVSDYPQVANDAVVTIWRSPITGDLGTSFSISGMTQVVRKSTTTTLKVGQENTIVLDSPVTLDPGTYAVVIGMRFSDPHILTLHLAGRESGNNTVGGPNRDRPANCNYTRSSDSYPAGRAYRGTGSIPSREAWDHYVGFGTFFTEHAAKVQECIRVGSFNDIFNPGDLMITLNSPGSVAATVPSDSSSSASNQSTSIPMPTTPPEIRRIAARLTALAVNIKPSKDTRRLTNFVVAFTTPTGPQEAGRCLIKPGKKSCTITGLGSQKTYYLTAGAIWNGADMALGPNRTPARAR